VSGRLSVVRQLLHYGADITAVTHCGNTCLHLASINGQSCIVSELLTRSETISYQRNHYQQVTAHSTSRFNDSHRLRSFMGWFALECDVLMFSLASVCLSLCLSVV